MSKKSKLELKVKSPAYFCEFEVEDEVTREYVCQQTGLPCPYRQGLSREDCEDYIMYRIQKGGMGY